MIRDSMGQLEYWNKWVNHSQDRVIKMRSSLARPSLNPAYDPQYAFDAAFEFLRLICERYSRGDSVAELAQHFCGVNDMWELSNRLADEVCKEHHLQTCRDWTFELSNLNHYNWCFWLVGLALTLDISDEQWNRLVALIGSAGQDELLDRVMATRQKDRIIGAQLAHAKPYARLLKSIDALPEQRPQLLREFVDNWYSELARKGKGELWWYTYGDPVKSPLDSGSYFGRWCIEAAVVAKVFCIDDTPCLGHEYYPGDLLRPGGASTHAGLVKAKPSFWKMLFGGSRGI